MSGSRSQSLAFRAVMAVVLLVGFYVMALAIAGGLLYIPYAELRYAERLHLRIALACRPALWAKADAPT